MSYGTFSRIETIGSDSDGSNDNQSITTVDSQPGLPGRRVNWHIDEEESTVPGGGFFNTIGSICCEQYHSAKQARHGGTCCGWLKAFFLCITLPFYVWFKPFIRARPSRRKVTHHGIVYFYILMSWTIVLNLLEVRIKHDYEERVYQVLQYSNATIMALSLIAMLYIAWATREEVTWTIHRNNLTFYFRTGLYVFGVANMVYTSLNLYNDFSCKDGLNILLNISQFLFTAGQIMFHNYFYQAKLPSRGWLMQICLAHILGTNLSLWIGTICKEVYTPEPKNTSDCSPINMGHSEKYFYPLFVEYLLLVAGMVYELWIDLKIPRDRIRGARRDWINNAYQEQLSGTTEVSLPVRLVSEGRRRTFSPSLALSLVLGTAFGAIFFSSMLGAYDSSWKGKQRHRSLYNNFIIANICFYCTQLIACYVIKVCGQSQPANSKRKSFNVDDSLLYFGLAGIILWEGVHFYYLFFEEAEEPIDFVHGLLGAIQDVVQTVILVSVRRLLSREDENAQTISNFSLFLLATNFAFWIQNSFYMEQQLHNPGEDEHTDGEENLLSKLQVFAYILNPIIIFFRFHSATCCYQMWVIFSRPVLNEN